MESVQVKEYMNSYPVTFSPDMRVEAASYRFIKTKQMGGPVVDEKGKLLGFLSESEVLKSMLSSIYNDTPLTKVEDIMRTDVLSVKPYDSIIELAQTMLQPKPKLYPVIDDDGVLVGTINRHEVLMAIDKHMRARFHLTTHKPHIVPDN